MHSLHADHPEHLWLIHRLFLEEINEDCSRFQLEWNRHGVSRPKTHDQTPAVSTSSDLKQYEKAEILSIGYEVASSAGEWT
jgi:hypothetical protein